MIPVVGETPLHHGQDSDTSVSLEVDGESNRVVAQVNQTIRTQDQRGHIGRVEKPPKIGLLVLGLIAAIWCLVAVVGLVSTRGNSSSVVGNASVVTTRWNDGANESQLRVKQRRSLQNLDETIASFIPTESPSFSPSTLSPTVTIAPSASPSSSSSPSSAPSYYPTMAPTVPVLGCRGDRFDNEGNRQKNNRLFAGQYVCSDDDNQRYWFGLDPNTGNLIWKDTQLDIFKTYYFNEYGYPAEETAEQKEGNRTDDETPTVLDYFFTLSTEAAFRIYRVQRTEDYEILEESLHWELPSTYNVTIVYEDCLFSHDCPYMHLHHDGVMVLAWLDFSLSKWCVPGFSFAK